MLKWRSFYFSLKQSGNCVFYNFHVQLSIFLKIFTLTQVSLAERRQVVQDICSGVGAKLREANVSDVQRQLLDEGGRETRLNGSMDLQVPDVCLERPQSQQNSGR